jgi:hypothetical protein
MAIPTAGYTVEETALGGMGKISTKVSPSTGAKRLFVVTITGQGNVESYLHIGGFPIGTESFYGTRVLHAYYYTGATQSLLMTVWEGLLFEVCSTPSGEYLVFEQHSSSTNPPSSSSVLLLGGSSIALDADRHLMVKDLGTPEEESEAMLGNMRVRVGRFGDTWAIGMVKP